MARLSVTTSGSQPPKPANAGLANITSAKTAKNQNQRGDAMLPASIRPVNSGLHANVACISGKSEKAGRPGKTGTARLAVASDYRPPPPVAVRGAPPMVGREPR